MGLERQTLRFLLRSRAQGVDFKKTITVGRQDLLVTPNDLVEEFAAAGQALERAGARRILTQHDRFAEGLFPHLGAETVDSLDASQFEGASVLQDLNQPLAGRLREAYSAVVELGTLEHVFNFPQAIRNLMEMTAVGGHLMMVTPCNNFMGHGFYQFSPELFFRVLAEANGFEVREMIYNEGDADWYRVSDPLALRSRVGHNTAALPAQLMILARKRAAVVKLLASTPMQSDYDTEWTGRPDKARDPDRLSWFTKYLDASGEWPAEARWKRALKALVPGWLRKPVTDWRLGRRMATPPDPKMFDKL